MFLLTVESLYNKYGCISMFCWFILDFGSNSSQKNCMRHISLTKKKKQCNLTQTWAREVINVELIQSIWISNWKLLLCQFQFDCSHGHHTPPYLFILYFYYIPILKKENLNASSTLGYQFGAQELASTVTTIHKIYWKFNIATACHILYMNKVIQSF